METTTYKKSYKSPYQANYKPISKTSTTSSKRHIAQIEIDACIVDLNFTASFTEDKNAVAMFKDTPNLIAFICTLKRGDTILGQGRAMNALSQNNKYIQKAVQSVWNYSLLDAVSKTTRIIDAFQTDNSSPSQYVKPVTASGPIVSYKAKEYAVADSESEMASDKQKNYLTQLINNISNEEERFRLEGQIYSLSKTDASELIQSLQK